jgi:uncharacterized protein (DUF362 family)
MNNNQSNAFSRRSFLIGSVLGSASTLLAKGVLASGLARTPAGSAPVSAAPPRSLLPHRPHLLVTGRNADYRLLVQTVVEALGGPKVLARRDEQVVIKPTLAYNRLPGQGANVHPDVLRATVELALDAGARQVLVFDRTGLRAVDAYRVSGAYLALHRLGDARVKLVALADADFVPLAESKVAGAAAQLAGYQVCRYLLEADRVINLAAARVHPTRQVALGMANLLGLIGGGPADAAWRQHQDAELAVLAAAIRPDVTILDATRAVVRNGPVGLGSGDVARWDTVVASRDLLAVETYGARLFGVDAAGLPYLGLAHQLGAGTPHLTRARVYEL